jgi:hypothetical protein
VAIGVESQAAPVAVPPTRRRGLALNAEEPAASFDDHVVTVIFTERQEHREALLDELRQDNGFGYVSGYLGARHTEQTIEQKV